MADDRNEVWVTGIGLMSSLGEGLDTHWSQLTSGQIPKPSVDRERIAPYPVHPMVDYDISGQIPKRSDQRQMGPWQHLGTYTAGLALDDAGIAGNPELLAATNMIIAAAGGMRDFDVDSSIMEEMAKSNNPGAVLNSALSNELRPTLFLAQLSNLLAGNISIVHGVTDSSRTFMGEEMAGVSAVETAVLQIQMDQGEIFLVGGAFIAERADMLMTYEFGHDMWTGEYGPVWARNDPKGGMILGSAGAFLILEAKHHAEARGVTPYARIRKVLSDRCNRKPGAAKQVADSLFENLSDLIPGGALPVLSGACGIEPQLSEERDFLLGLAEKGYQPAVRGVTTLFGNAMEAQFPIGVALAALAVSKQAFYDPFDDTGIESDYSADTERVLISNWGHWRGEGLALVDKPSGALRGKA